ncbi:hypothetical protein [Nocardia brasiliensis]|uniref:hypothetical protein n=1 Tax=Nocardia brasiliensis TaxID=37326 RepID=UPI00245383C7|nr:hypothetical protein [Nocardia brasiliensis]
MRLDLPLMLSGSVSLGQLEKFVKVAQTLGATSETLVEVKANEHNDDILDCLRADIEASKVSIG